MPNPLAKDLDHILAHTQGLWDELRRQQIFITGGTGFFGCWLLESFCWANDRLDLRAEATVLTRNPEAFAAKVPHLAGHPAIRCHAGDVRDFVFPAGTFHHVIHAAADFHGEDSLLTLDTTIQGTRRTLDFARQCGAVRLLLTSSGAVYGRQPPDLTHIPEDYHGGPDTLRPDSSYAEGKRIAELLCRTYQQDTGLDVRIARCFAFLGPHMPLDGNFAIGNFIRDALRGGPIRVAGDGSPIRSYLYAADLAIWLWTILLSHQAQPVYNIGSEETISIGDLSRKIAALLPRGDVMISQPRQPDSIVERYVPSTQRAARDLKLRVLVGLEEGLTRTLAWCRAMEQA